MKIQIHYEIIFLLNFIQGLNMPYVYNFIKNLCALNQKCICKLKFENFLKMSLSLKIIMQELKVYH